MSMRVMMLGPYPPSLARIDGGVAAATTYVSQALSKMPDMELIGVRVAGPASTRGAIENLGWPVVDLELGRFSVSTFFRRQRRDFDALLRQYKPDLVHAQGADASGYLAVRSGWPAVVTIHGILSECARLRTNLVKRLRELAQARLTEHHVVERAAHIIAISPYVANYYRSRLHGAIYDVPNAVAPQYFELERKPVAGRLLFAGRISRGKGLIDLVHAVARVSEMVSEVILAGAAPDRDFASQLRAVIDDAGQTSKFGIMGLLDERSLLDEFAKASALVLPSYQETAPMVIQQAMAAGLPVIATRVGGIPNQIDDEASGMLFDAGNINQLADRLRRVLTDQELSRRLAMAAQARATESFTAEKVAFATRAAYRRVLA